MNFQDMQFLIFFFFSVQIFQCKYISFSIFHLDIQFRRGYATERKKGLLIVEKLDYLQSKLLQKIFFSLSRPLKKIGSWLNEVSGLLLLNNIILFHLMLGSGGSFFFVGMHQ